MLKYLTVLNFHVLLVAYRLVFASEAIIPIHACVISAPQKQKQKVMKTSAIAKMSDFAVGLM